MRCPACGSRMTAISSCSSCGAGRDTVMNELVRKVVAESRGSVEGCMLISEEGLVLAHNPVAGYEPYVAAAASAIGAAANAMAEVIGSENEITRIDLRLGDGSVIAVIPLPGMYLAVKTSRRPNLGMVKIVLDRLLGP